MRDFTVHEPPAMASTREERAEKLVFVKDGFSWGAFFFGPFYFAARGEWLGAIAYVLASIAVHFLFLAFDASADSAAFGYFVLNFIAGFEANELRRYALARAGWREFGATSGRDRDECERRFIEAWLPTEPPITPAAWRTSSAPPARFTTEVFTHMMNEIRARVRRRAPTGFGSSN